MPASITDLPVTTFHRSGEDLGQHLGAREDVPQRLGLFVNGASPK
ncbi:hypothetical protein [Lentzea sp. NEAU-D7]|nr:hypothetical protein [Lentzea sp. NEAU-D7]MCX2954793.1 hypothetical protein [Lentzea sp. NEAU-D7]